MILEWLRGKNPCENCTSMKYEIEYTGYITNEKISVKCATCGRWKRL